MNWCQVQDEWSQFRFVFRSYWSMLSEEDLDRIAARRAELISVLQKRYCITKEEAARQVADFEREVRFPGAVK